MASLSKEYRNQLARAVLNAREAAESGANKALHALGVDEPDAPTSLSPDQRLLRRALRAQARQLGDKDDPEIKGEFIPEHLAEKIAYDQWHRMLFARFLAENDLLISPQHGVSVSLDDCRELAPDLGLHDEWQVATRFAAAMLPQIFRSDDPAGKVNFAQEDRNKLQKLVMELPRDTFLADDSLGWVYQFWQTKRKEEVNASGKKIGADELAPVTQLFTEDYMVLFLLHNTLGAWWAGKKMPKDGITANTEEEARASVALRGINWEYLRFIKDEQTSKWRPAAGTFFGWPKTAKELKVLDPCMGSGHFLVAEFRILVAMRMAEEGLSKADAVSAVLRENLFGLEIDQRCTQIAAFNLALTAWKICGYQKLPSLNLACCGLGINSSRESWLKLANGDEKLRWGMNRLYDLFKDSPLLGSLVNPIKIPGSGFNISFSDLQPLLTKALSREEIKRDDDNHEMGVTAQGAAQAAEILNSAFTLIATNVPYLARGKQNEVMRDYCEKYYPESKNDLATVFLEHCLELCHEDGTVSIILPQNWLYQKGYKELRQKLLKDDILHIVVKLGAGAFETISGEVVKAILIILSRERTGSPARIKNNERIDFIRGIDVSGMSTVKEKTIELLISEIKKVDQSKQLENPDAVISVDKIESTNLLRDYGVCIEGLSTGDGEQFIIKFWELEKKGIDWEFFIQNVNESTFYGGRTDLILWENDNGKLRSFPGSHNFPSKTMNGFLILGNKGLRITQMAEPKATIYTGEIFGKSAGSLVLSNNSLLPELWCYVTSSQFILEVNKINQSLYKPVGTFLKVPFDVDYWKHVASEKFPHGLPAPYSKDPTQWLFNGQPPESEQPLQVSVARLLGYKWPRQTGSSFSDCPAISPDGLEAYADEDGIICINAVKGETNAAERLRALLGTAYGNDWSNPKQSELLSQVEFAGKTLEYWLRNGFFEQHCQLFHQRPFIWNIWDGLKNGFSVLVNYHKLDRANLEKLTYTYLGDWITRQRAAVASGEEGSDAILSAAQELQRKLRLILEGEPLYDIFVRWKTMEKQPIGWEPDLNDGVRLNIRPFMTAGILRKNPKINWNKDRGTDVPSAPWYSTFHGERINEHHLTLEEKRTARAKR